MKAKNPEVPTMIRLSKNASLNMLRKYVGMADDPALSMMRYGVCKEASAAFFACASLWITACRTPTGGVPFSQ